MISRGWWAELRRFIGMVGLAVFLGWVLGGVRWGLALGCALYLLIHLVQIYRLDRWLARRQRTPLPDGSGVWGDIFGNLEWLQRQTWQRRQKLRAIIERFEQSSQAMPDATVILRANHEIEWLNQAAHDLLDLRSPQDIGHPVTDLVRSPAFTRYLLHSSFAESVEINSPGNEDVVLSVRVVPYGDDRLLLVARDVTRVPRLEQIRRDFVANVSHELRSPLTVIRGYAETMRGAADVPEEWHKPLDQIEQQSVRMCRIVDDLLQLSRIESNLFAPGDSPVSVAKMLETIRTDARGLTGENLKIEIEADPTVELAGEYNELYSAFSNLIFNAVQYTPVFKTISLRWHASEAGASLEVEDQGVGIEPEHIPRLTERFYRVDKARSRAVGGTGLGLAIVKHVLMRHEASLRIESEIGEGSTFICQFPRSRTRIAGETRRSEARSAP